MNIKKIFSVIGMAMLLLIQGQTTFAQSISADKFEYYKEIQNEGEGLRSLEIDPEIYDATASSMSDIRIFDSENTEVQYHKYSGSFLDSKVTSDFRIIDRSDDQNIIKATFLREHCLKVYDRIRVEVSGGNYLLSPQLYGSQDGINFSPIKSKGFIYNFYDESKGRNYNISLDEVDYKYIKAEFKKVMGKVSSEDILNASYTRKLPYIPMEKQIKSEIVSTSNVDQTTEIILDMKYTNLPISNIIINPSNQNYYRKIQVLTSNDMKNFKLIATDKISSFDIEDYKVENKKIRIDQPCLRYIKLIIQNQDNGSLTIPEIDCLYRPDTLIFQAEAGKMYRLYYGSRACEAPTYDISHIADKINKQELQKSSLGQMNKNPNYKKQDIPFTERNSYSITIAIVLIVGVLGFVVVKNLKEKL